jgi:serine/threonine protein kinase
VLLKYEIDADGEKKMVAKISDFGLCRQTQLVQQLQGASVDNPTWLAPEVLRNEPYNASADMYSMGVIMWELLTRKDFGGDVQFTHMLADDIVSGKRPTVPECPALFEDYGMLLQQCWSSDARQRPAGREALACLRNMVDFANDPELKEQYELAMLNRALDNESMLPSGMLHRVGGTSYTHLPPLSSQHSTATLFDIDDTDTDSSLVEPAVAASSSSSSAAAASQSPIVARRHALLQKAPSDGISSLDVGWDAVRMLNRMQRQLDDMAESHERALKSVRRDFESRVDSLHVELHAAKRRIGQLEMQLGSRSSHGTLSASIHDDTDDDDDDDDGDDDDDDDDDVDDDDDSAHSGDDRTRRGRGGNASDSLSSPSSSSSDDDVEYFTFR